MERGNLPQVTSNDQPIFVLRYRRCAIILHWFLCLLLIPAMFYGIFLDPISKPIIEEVIRRMARAFVFIVSIDLLFNLLFFKEVRLYSDRISKVWHLFGSRDIPLRDAMLKGRNFYARPRRIYDLRKNPFLRFLSGIFYREDMASKTDYRKMTSLLAELSGRSVQEFEQSKFSFKRLIMVKK